MDFDIPEMEKEILKKWEKSDLSKLNEDAIKDGKIYSIDTPPPTVSGEIHIGHAYSYPHQDIAARFRRMMGYYVFYPSGFDNNGLATERFVEKTLKLSLNNIPVKDAIEKCETVSGEAIAEMKKSFIRLGLSQNFENSYITYSKGSWKISQGFFLDLFKKGIAYRSEGMTISCPTCRTAISQIEMEDSERETDFVYIDFRSDDGAVIQIATTRPEMLAACVAIALNPEDERAKKFSGKKFRVPLYRQEVEIITDPRVLMDKGTGAEMVCTFGDQTDYEIWKDHSLKLIRLLDERGFIRDGGLLEGLKVEEGRKKIKNLLKESGDLKSIERIKHSVNTHERCGTPIEIGVSKQWYLRYLDMKDDLIQQGRKIKWTPDFMRIRYENWVNGLKWDWCISRQRIMGISIPVWYCNSCGEVILPEKSELPVDPRFDEKKKCPKCSSNDVTPETDVLDTWFTSSTSPTISLRDSSIENNGIPMSARFQGHDIITTWAFTTIYRYMVHFQKIPWDNIVISGNVFDSKGQKMSKSKGNVVYPMELVDKYGADGVRLWGSSSSTWDDISLKEQELTRGRRTIIKIYNAISLISALPEKRKTEIKLPFNRWIAQELNRTIKKAEELYSTNDFAKARTEIDNFFWTMFCDNYLEIIKSFVSRGSEEEKDEIAYVAREVALDIMKLYAPIAPFITDKAYEILGMEGSIHEQKWPVELEDFEKDAEIFSNVISVISGIRTERSKLKSGKQAYKGFIISTPVDLKEFDKRVIKETLREENLVFRKDRAIKIESIVE